MSADTGMSYQSRQTRQHDGSNGRGYWHGEPWKPVEILAMVLGFFVFWPIGLAVLGWKFWQKKSGYPGDIISFGREKWGSWANWTRGSERWGFAVNKWPASGFGMGSTGNRAFDEWRAIELARLEEERQKLVAAEENSRNSWKLYTMPGIARSSSGSWTSTEINKAARPGNRARSYNKRRRLRSSHERRMSVSLWRRPCVALGAC